MSTKPCCTFDQLCRRAYELADSGRYSHWEEVAAEIERGNCPGALHRLPADPMLRRALNVRCEQARNRNR